MSTIAAPAFFHAFNDSNYNRISEGVAFPITDFKYCGGGNTDEIYTERALLYGEIKGYTGSGWRTQYDMGFAGTLETLNAHGWQAGTNGERQWGPTDDGAYAVAAGIITLEVKNSTSTSSSQGYSEAEETRIYGLRLTP